MSYYRYQYKQQRYIPPGMKCPPPVFPQQCHPPGVVKCVQCPGCAPTAAKVCSVRKTLQSPRCSSGCVETHVVEGHSCSSSSCCCSPRSLNPCTVTFPQPQGTGREQLCLSQCGQVGVKRCPHVCAPTPQVCTPAPLCQHSSYPYSYQWSNSYQYNCGQQ
ncbi:PREDICTED: small proline-rich protein 2B-like [Lepidothrix coronata]|uniref:Small proline-rich protein 2B-like n=1 Tax=Lepidothrix coronata TaxID=321398 RepID=A0A6J0J591_9PASS|nr:PREDICTED: small proline-rich protein 2B-like [Lepidothrix coronata]